MALNKRPTFANRPKISMVKIEPASGTAPVDLLVAGNQGDKIVGLFATGEAVSNRDVRVQISRSGTNYVIETVTVPVNAGLTAAVPPADLFTAAMRTLLPKDADQQNYLFLVAGDTLKVNAQVAVSAANEISVFAIHGSFDDEAP